MVNKITWEPQAMAELSDPWRTAVYVAICAGLRASELSALRWEDIVIAAGEIRLCRGIERQHIGQMKTEASRKPVPMELALANVLTNWRGQCAYNQPGGLHLRFNRDGRHATTVAE